LKRQIVAKGGGGGRPESVYPKARGPGGAGGPRIKGWQGIPNNNHYFAAPAGGATGR